ncbi:MAG: hypothetical protein ACT4OI_11025 [Methanobacteriota archaeon]
MRFRLEADLRPPVATWLRSNGFEVHDEVAMVGRRADLVGVRWGRVAAVELKVRDWSEALRQAVAYQLAADWSWVAMPLDRAARAHRHRAAFEAEGVGLLAVDEAGRVRVALPAEPSPRLLAFSRAAWLEPTRHAVNPSLLFSIEETDLQAF